MFTGIITDIGMIEMSDIRSEGGRYFRIKSNYPADCLYTGCSISCDGVCLTVVDFAAYNQGCWFEVDVSNETLELTTLACCDVNRRVNLERALRVGDELGGNWVTGHVDGVASITDKWSDGASRRFNLQPPSSLMRFIACKGSVVLDGVSLTVNDITADLFSINLIQYSLQSTIWDTRQTGDMVNIEVDVLARHVIRLMEFNNE